MAAAALLFSVEKLDIRPQQLESLGKEYPMA